MNPLTREYAVEIDYLLHRMNPDERERLGKRIVEDPEAFDRVLDAETELYDAYVRGGLPDALRAGFDRHLLRTPAQRQRLAAAELLARRRGPARVSRVLFWAVAASLVLALAVGSMYWGSGPAPGDTAVVRLRLTRTRGPAAIPEVRVTPGSALEIRVAWDPDEPPGEFRAEVSRQGVAVWRGPVQPGGDPPELSPRLDPGLLAPGLHELAVKTLAGEPVGFAEFRVR